MKTLKLIFAFLASVILVFGYAAPVNRDLPALSVVKKFECIPMKFHFKDGGYKELSDKEIASIGGIAFKINENEKTGHDLKGNPIKYKLSVDTNKGPADVYAGDGFALVILRNIKTKYHSVGFIINNVPGWVELGCKITNE